MVGAKPSQQVAACGAYVGAYIRTTAGFLRYAHAMNGKNCWKELGILQSFASNFFALVSLIGVFLGSYRSN